MLSESARRRARLTLRETPPGGNNLLFEESYMPLFRRKKPVSDGAWIEVPPGQERTAGSDNLARRGTPTRARGKKNKKQFRVVTVRGRQEQAWLDSGMWQPLQETVIPAEAKAPLHVVHYGTYGSDGMRHDGPPGGAYSSVYDQYAMQGGDLYTRDEVRTLKQWDTRKPFPGFDPKLGSKTLDIYSED